MEDIPMKYLSYLSEITDKTDTPISEFLTISGEILKEQKIDTSTFIELLENGNFNILKFNNLYNQYRGVVEKNHKILVLCVDDETYEDQTFYKIIRKKLKHKLENYNVFYVGYQLTERLPFVINGDFTETLEYFNFNTNYKFDIIVSEHCPTFAFDEKNKEMINTLLKHDGIFITPNYDIDYKYSIPEKINSRYSYYKKDTAVK